VPPLRALAGGVYIAVITMCTVRQAKNQTPTMHSRSVFGGARSFAGRYLFGRIHPYRYQHKGQKVPRTNCRRQAKILR